MVEERHNDPIFKPGEIQPGETARITLNSGKAVANGSNKWGSWNLWVVEVEDQLVFDKDTKAKTENYTGKAVMFPSEKLHEQLLKMTGGVKEGTVVDVTKTLVDGKLGVYKNYTAILVAEGEKPSSTTTHTESKYMADFQIFTNNKVFDGTKESFIRFGQMEPYQLKKVDLENSWAVYEREYKK